jgi:hypothetical protein
VSHIPEGIATQDGRTPATPNPGYCACMSLEARIRLQDAHLQRDLTKVRDAMAQVQEWAPTNLRRGQ